MDSLQYFFYLLKPVSPPKDGMSLNEYFSTLSERHNLILSKHFAFMKRLSSDEFSYSGSGKNKIRVIDNTDAAEKFLDRHHTLNEELMKELGVTIVWYETYDEIPNIIEQILQY